MFCPKINGECKGNVCRFWSEIYSDCSIGKYYDSEMKFQKESDDAESMGLIKVSRDLGKTLNKVYVSSLLRSSSISDSEKLVIKKLYFDIEDKSEKLELERLYSK